MKHNFNYNGKNSLKDYGVVMESYSVSSPRKKKVLVDIPYASSDLDFSYMLNDENLYEDRVITVNCSIVCNSREEMKDRVSKITTWLLDTKGKQELLFSSEKTKYLAEVRESIEYSPFDRACTFTVTFTANPYRIGHCPEGSRKEWDCFNFNEDVLQESIFNLDNSSQNVELINVGRSLVPKIIVKGADVRILFNGYSTTVSEGEIYNYSLELKKGINKITISSTGKSNIEFYWRKETL